MAFRTDTLRNEQKQIEDSTAPKPPIQPQNNNIGLGIKNPLLGYADRLKQQLQSGLQNAITTKQAQPETVVRQAPTNQAVQIQQPNNGLQTPGMITEAGKIYQQRVTDNLLKPSSVAVNAQNTADTNASRRNYQTQKQTQEMMAQSPFGAGSRQYQRALMEGQAGANSANLAEQNQANAVQRSESELAMNRASGLEDSEFAKALGERGYVDQQTSRYSALIQDTKGRQEFNRQVASGINPAVALQNVIDKGGTINENYRGMDNMQQLQAEAEGWIRATTGIDPKTPEGIKLVRDRMIARDEAKNKPLEDATTARELQAIEEKQRLGQPLTPEEENTLKSSNEWESYAVGAVPVHSTEVLEFKKNNPDGMINIEGTPYKLGTAGHFKIDGQKHTTDYVELINPKTGEKKYIYRRVGTSLGNNLSDITPQQLQA
jgi:hypothetical protein